jgi:hypothetical protein
VMRRALAALVAAWAVLAVALTLALAHRPGAGAQATSFAPIVLVRQPNGSLTPLRAVPPHATTQTSGAGGSLPVVGSGQLVSQAGPAAHTTTSTS